MVLNCTEVGFGECTGSDGLVKYCFEVESDVFQCDCPSWWGYTGEFCDKTSVQLYYYRFISLLIFQTTAGSLYWDCSNTFAGVGLYRSLPGTAKTMMRKARLPSLLLLGLIKSTFFLIYTVLNVIGAFTSGYKYDFLERKQSERVYPVNGKVWVLLYFASFASLTLQSVEILMSWLGLISTLEQFQIPFRYRRVTGFVRKFAPYINWGSLTFWLFIIISSYFLPQFHLGIISFVVYTIFVFFVRRAMKDALRGDPLKVTTDKSLKQVEQIVLKSSLMLIICWTGIGLSSKLSHFGGRYSINSTPGSFSLGMFGQNLSIFFATAFSYTVSWYVSKSLNTFKTFKKRN